MRLLLLALLFAAVPVQAAILHPVTCSTSDVQASVNGAVTGDTVQMPAGTCNYTTSVKIDGKSITLLGKGPGVTTITATLGTEVFRIGSQAGTGNSSRIANFSIVGGTITVDGDGWRVDHMTINSGVSGTLLDGVHAYGLRTGVCCGPTGVVDHINFIDARVMVDGYPDLAWTAARSLRSSSLGLGDANAVYVEDSTYLLHGEPNAQDCDYAGRYVQRFNTITDSSIDAHSNQGFSSCRRWEVYNNTIQQVTAPYFTALFIRGGTGTIFNNTITGGFSEVGLSFDNVRTFTSNTLGQCNGSSIYDGNQLANGWPCRDQIGWVTDSSSWTVQTSPPTQLHEQAFFWGNSWNGTQPIAINIRNGSGAWIQANRDYYNAVASFNGTVGVGSGTIASRPATCTTGVGYWATDQGTWNKKVAGTSGNLYKCTAPNVWALYYTPYTYPHPRTYGPSGLRVGP